MDPIVWQGLSEPSLEYLDLQIEPEPRAMGTIVSVWDGEPIRLDYEIDCEPDWAVRRMSVRLDGGAARRQLDLRVSKMGDWSDETGKPVPALAGCLYVDLQATPFTNSLPIRRMRLAPGETRDLRVAYVGVPSLEMTAADQRYTRLDDEGLPRYTYESGDFKALLVVDDTGIVVDYEGLWRRIAP